MHELFKAEAAHVHDERVLDALPAAAGQKSSDGGADAEQHKPQRVAVHARLHFSLVGIVEVAECVGHEHARQRHVAALHGGPDEAWDKPDFLAVNQRQQARQRNFERLADLLLPFLDLCRFVHLFRPSVASSRGTVTW